MNRMWSPRSFIPGVVAVACALLSGSAGAGQSPAFESTAAFITSYEDAATIMASVRKGLRRADFVQIDLDAMPEQPFAFEIASPELGVYSVELQPHSVRSARYRLRTQVAGRALIELPPGPVRTYRGTIHEFPGSVVAASLEEHGVRAVFRFPDGSQLWLEPVADLLPNPVGNEHLLYGLDDILPTDGMCGVIDDAARKPTSDDVGEGADGEFIFFDCAELGIDADWHYYDDHDQSVEDVEAQINSIINLVNLQYEEEVGIHHEITDIVVRTSEEDNPYTTSDPTGLLNQFQDEWNQVQIAIPRDVAQLFTGRNLSGPTIGIAATPGVCTGFNEYSLVESDYNGVSGSIACKTDLTAHELGHNWSANHCDCSDWTMHPNIQCANQFHPEFSIPEITDYRDDIDSECLTLCDGSLEQGYCTASSLDDSAEFISLLSIAGMEHSSGASTFSDFTGTTIELIQAQAYSVEVQLGNPHPDDGVRLWVDWNHDEDFYDPGEKTTIPGYGPGPHLELIGVPSSALLGPTRMRVRVERAGIDSTFQPCGVTPFGEVEDYTIVVVEPPPPPPVEPATLVSVVHGGQVIAGELSDAAESDDVYFEIESVPTAGDQIQGSRFTLISPVADPSYMNITVEFGVSSLPMLARFSIRDWQEGVSVPVEFAVLDTTDDIAIVEMNFPDPERFVHQSTQAILISALLKQSASDEPFIARYDLVEVAVAD